MEIDPSDDHFTAEKLTGNANLLDDTPSVCARYDNSSCNRASGTESDFARSLVSDPNDPNNCTDWGTDTDGMRRGTPTGATSSDVVDGDVCNGAGDEWMHLDSDFANQDSTLSDSDDYCIDSVALRGSAAASNGAFDQSLPLYSHDEKPRLPTASTRTEKQFKNDHPEWVKQEEPGFPNYQQDLPVNPTSISSVKLELSKCDPTQTPSLRLNHADILSSWPDREIYLPKDDNSPQLVPRDDSNSDGIGHRYQVGLVPDLTSAPYGLDAHGNPTTMYGGCGPGSMGSGGGVVGGDDSMANSGNARELRVNRYREKRRTRDFSKKIRYEVRKLNAERKPRMKGRFVKRSPGREA